MHEQPPSSRDPVPQEVRLLRKGVDSSEGKLSQRMISAFSERRDQVAQAREDYALGGGIREGLKKAVTWGVLGGLTGAFVGGGVLGGGAEVLLYQIDHINNDSQPRLFDTNSDNPLQNPYLFVPLALAVLSALVLGSYAFYQGMISPFHEGRRLRTQGWYDFS